MRGHGSQYFNKIFFIQSFRYETMIVTHALAFFMVIILSIAGVVRTAIIVICPFGGNNDVDEGVEKGGSAQCCILAIFSPENSVKFIQFP